MPDKPSNRLQLSVVTTAKLILEAECDSVLIPASEGYVTILPNHTPLISLVGAGTLTYSDGGKEEILAVAGGFFEVSDNAVKLLVPLAERPDEIDVEAARKEAEDARNEMSGATVTEQTLIRRKLARAEARLAVGSG